MRVIATMSPSILSKTIRWCFSESASHIAFVFDDDKWLVQSNLLGVNIRVFKNFVQKTKCIIVDEIKYDLNLLEEEDVFQSLISETSEDEYDYPGFAYFCWRGLLFKLFKKPLPKVNKWGKANMHLCTEMIKKLPKKLTKLPDNVDLGITTPMNAMKILRGAQNA